MKAWQITAARKMERIERESAAAGGDSVKVKLTKTAVSHFDMEFYKGAASAEYPVIPCRQAAGLVVEADEPLGLTRGQRVGVTSCAPCGACGACLAGKPAACEKPLIYGAGGEGFLKDFCVVPRASLIALPEQVTDEEAVFIEHVSLMLSAFNKLELEKGRYVAICGAGALALIFAQLALYYQLIPVLIDQQADRLELAKNLGVYYTVNSGETDPLKKIISLTGGGLCDAVAHIRSSHSPLSNSLKYAAAGGKLCLCGGNFGGGAQTADLSVVADKQLTVYGVNNGAKFVTSAINMLANKNVKTAPLVSKQVGFNDAPAVFKEIAADASKYIKVLINNDK